jgi:hypothetical protein
MKKTTKENPLTTFRKANEARQAVVKKSIPKAQFGGRMKMKKSSNEPVAVNPPEKMPLRPAGQVGLPLFNSSSNPSTETYYDRKTGYLRSPRTGGADEDGISYSYKKIANVPAGEIGYSNEIKSYDPGTLISNQKKGGSTKSKMKMGGTTKTTKIVGAKKNVKKK